jgi:hypothetical protein
MTSPDTSSYVFILAEKDTLRVSTKTQDRRSLVCPRTRNPKGRKFTNTQGLRRLRFSSFKPHCQRAVRTPRVRHPRTPDGSKCSTTSQRNGNRARGHFPEPTPLRFKKLVREHSKTAGSGCPPAQPFLDTDSPHAGQAPRVKKMQRRHGGNRARPAPRPRSIANRRETGEYGVFGHIPARMRRHRSALINEQPVSGHIR